MSNSNVLVVCPFMIMLLYCSIMISIQDRAKDNGDIFVQHKEQQECVRPIIVQANDSISSEGTDVVLMCNSSFSIPSGERIRINKNNILTYVYRLSLFFTQIILHNLI